MNKIRAMVGVVVVLVSSACYHATIETGLPAGSDVVSNQWAHGFIFGLIAPSTVNTASQCKNGVAKVETQHSFLNMLAQFFTASLYTPMQIDVTCASSNRMSAIDGAIKARNASPEALKVAIAEAASLSMHTGQPSFVVF